MDSANPNPPLAQRRVLNHGNAGRKPIDHKREAPYSAIQTSMGAATRADMTSIPSTLDPSMFKTVSSLRLLVMRTVYPKQRKEDAY